MPPHMQITPELMLEAYKQGIFPMAQSASDELFDFYCPENRALLPINRLHIPKRLKRTIRQIPYEIRIDTDFEQTIKSCAEKNKNRQTTWINKPIQNIFIELHKMGFAHSVECWKDGKFAGGLYGLAIGRVFCGESMVSKMKDASKIALVHLAARLQKAGFTILDAQLANPHLEQFGLYEIPHQKYEELIKTEMTKPANFNFTNIPETKLVLEYIAGRKNN